MKFLLLILLTLLIDPSKISEVNKAKEKAKESYARGEYKEAAAQYRTLVDSLGVNEEEVAMNMAHSYYQLNDTLNAKNTYLGLTNSADPQFKSVSYQQLGMLAHREGKLEEALAHFKSALKANPANEDARFNYELVKKKLDEQQKQQQRQDQDKKDQEQKENKDQQDKKDQKQNEQQQKDKEKKEQQEKEKKEQEKKEQEKKDQEKKKQEQEQKKDEEKKDEKKEPQPSSEKMKMMKISEEKAKMVLEAMKNQEIQYLQQNKRKATKPKDKGKPDW